MSVYFTNEITQNDKKKEANKRIGKKTKAIRKSLKMTQKQFAEEYNIKGGCTAVSKIENAKRSLSADLLPILAESGNIYVEQFYRENVAVANVLYNCLSRMNVESSHIDPIMAYMNIVAEDAITNIGAAKLFDLIFTVVRSASVKGNVRGIMMDEINVIDLDDYGDNKNSRYINYLKEMAIYNTSKE